MTESAGKQPATTPEVRGDVVERDQRATPDSGTLLPLQRLIGNRAVARMIQRGDPPAAPPGPGPATAPAKKTLSNASFSGPKFDLTHTPAGPVPATGKVDVVHKVHVTFKHFDEEMIRQAPYRNMRFNAAQRATFRWTADEQTKFKENVKGSVKRGWAGKFTFHLTDPVFEEYRASCDVRVEDAASADDANTKITVHKFPPGSPRFRSFVDGDSSVLDSRDASERELQRTNSVMGGGEIGFFANNSADMGGDVESTTRSMIEIVKGQRATLPKTSTDPDGLPDKDVVVSLNGRASKGGSSAVNQAISQQRADAVAARLRTELPELPRVQVFGAGDKGSANDERFRRVDWVVHEAARLNTMAHEFGHMIGLGDEYIDKADGRNKGDKSSHHDKVKDLMGDEAAKEMIVDDKSNMMSVGGDVKKGHYVEFLERLNQITSAKWGVE